MHSTCRPWGGVGEAPANTHVTISSAKEYTQNELNLFKAYLVLQAISWITSVILIYLIHCDEPYTTATGTRWARTFGLMIGIFVISALFYMAERSC